MLTKSTEPLTRPSVYWDNPRFCTQTLQFSPNTSSFSLSCRMTRKIALSKLRTQDPQMQTFWRSTTLVRRGISPRWTTFSTPAWLQKMILALWLRLSPQMAKYFFTIRNNQNGRWLWSDTTQKVVALLNTTSLTWIPALSSHYVSLR